MNYRNVGKSGLKVSEIEKILNFKKFERHVG